MNLVPSEKTTTDASELSTALAQFGLSQYEECLHENGFETWEDATMITESDMAELGFRLGDRRKLQRAIREYSGSSASDAEYKAKNVPPPHERIRASGEQSEMMPPTSPTSTTRPYRRHARPDPNAPSRPKTAYMLYGEYVRKDPALSGSSFTKLAKETGKRWRELSNEERVNDWETPAAGRLREYKEALEIYKQTENYRSYQAYLEGFKQRHTLEATRSSDDKASIASKPGSSSQLPVPQAQEEEWEAIRQEELDIEDNVSEGLSQDAASPVKVGMAEVRHISRALGINPHLTRVALYPPEDMTTKAVEAFLHGTGSLVFLWDQDEALSLARSVYSPGTDSKPASSVEAFAIWFAYNTSHQSRITPEDLNLYQPPSSHAEHRSGVISERVSELGRLAAYIALDLRTASQPKAVQARVHFQSLNEWHRTLPPPMQLSRLSLADPLNMNWHTKRSLLQLHILFLGLFIEPYRTCLIDLGRIRLNDTPSDPRDLEVMKNIEEQCVLAARQSARVVSLLQSDNLIRSHCWVSVYTSFTGCAILLFSASQKLLELAAEEAGQDLSYASSHLNALSYCSYDNALARVLYTRLHIIYNDIREAMVSPVYQEMRESRLPIKTMALVPSSHQDSVEGVVNVSTTLSDLTERIVAIFQESLTL